MMLYEVTRQRISVLQQ